MNQTTSIKTYSELVKMDSFMDRFRYLQIGGRVGEETFGFDRYLNQTFYKTPEWIAIRDEVIIRDMGCDLGVLGRDIHSKILVHHMNPITRDDIIHRSEFLLNPEYLISTCKRTHDAIHYGDEELLYGDPIERTRFDTCPWRK